MPWSFDLVVFCIMVRAGELNPAEQMVLRVIAPIENQKLFCTRQHRAVRGKAAKLEAMQTQDLAMRLLDSSLSLMMPPANELKRPPTARDIALATAYWFL